MTKGRKMFNLWGFCKTLICLLLSSTIVRVSCSLSFSNYSSPFCNKDESIALLDFKNSFTIAPPEIKSLCFDQIASMEKTKSWKTETSCCEWRGVTCHPLTRHVIGLDLSCARLYGTIGSNSTLFKLRHLQTLNLANNFFIGSFGLQFRGSNISPKFGQFQHLTHLNLSFSFFEGEVPSEIAHLQRLTSLDLTDNNLVMSNFEVIIENLTALTLLQLDLVTINSSIPQSLVNRSSLTHLSLSSCSLHGKFPSSILDLPHLQVLNVAENPGLYTDIHLGNWSNSLEIINLSSVNFTNQLPHSLRHVSKPLRHLRLGRCNLNGPIPPWVWNVSEVIDLGSNSLASTLPSILSHLVSLQYLDLNSNTIEGRVNLNTFAGFKDLIYLDLSNTGLSILTTRTHGLNSTLNWPKLEYLALSSCNISEFPSLRPPEHMDWLDLSYNNIEGEIPPWLQNAGELLSTNLDAMLLNLNLSHNYLTHGLEHIPWNKVTFVDLSSNMLQGPLPVIPGNVTINSFLASNNRLSGTINPSFCNMNQIYILDLSKNNLEGEIPVCLLGSSIVLTALNLKSNRLNGTIPAKTSYYFNNSLVDLDFMRELMYLDLSYNQLEGVIPKVLSHFQKLNVLNLGNNKLNGTFPTWLNSLPQLRVLNLRFNRFHGPLSSSSGVEHSFPKLQILDISNNNFSGKLPTRFIKNLRAMMNKSMDSLGSPQYLEDTSGIYSFSVVLTINGVNQIYVKVITTLATFDISNNGYEGDIPDSIGQLFSLRSLNLSHNHFSGHIPESIGKLSLLGSLDLSSNMLTGRIPQELVSLTFLGVFNVSENHLEGPIPHGNNFDTYSTDSFKGNLALCEQPLPACGGSRVPSMDNARDNQSSYEDDENVLSEWEFIIMGFGSGMVVGLAWAYYMFSMGKPYWFIKLAYEMELALLDFRDEHFGRRARRLRNQET